MWRLRPRRLRRGSFDVAIEAVGHAPPFLEAQEHAFGDVALFVESFVAVVLDLAVLTRRNAISGTASSDA
jgi:hypothetical protein